MHMNDVLSSGTAGVVVVPIFIIGFLISVRLALDQNATSDDAALNVQKRWIVTLAVMFGLVCAGVSLYGSSASIQPPTPYPDLCGLQVPPGHHKAEFDAGPDHQKESRSNRHTDSHVHDLHTSVKHENHSSELGVNEKWIWVEIRGDLPKPVRAGQWEYSPDCFKIFKYDIAMQSWAGGCAKWCQENFGPFVWNAWCAFNLQNESFSKHHKSLRVLRACQKAEVAHFFQISTRSCWLLGLLFLFLALVVGACEYKVASFPEPKFDTHSVADARIKVMPLLSLPGNFTRAQVAMYDIVKMGLSLGLDITTDVVTSLTYFCHGQPYYGIVMLTVVLILGLRGVSDSGTSSVTWWLWSLNKAVPAQGLLQAKAGEAMEASVSLAVLVLFLFKTPLHGDDGEVLIGKAQLMTTALSLCSTLYAMYDAALSSWKLNLCRFYPDVELDFDKRWELLGGSRYEFLPEIYAGTVAVIRFACAGTLAFAVLCSPREACVLAFFFMLFSMIAFYSDKISGACGGKQIGAAAAFTVGRRFQQSELFQHA
eukprot:TRINITY_DN12614_c0_g2_i6.p1 TRINITY_DN12614_c0_g2~~TRINITY_DN12614_c0_g2_i6.p1  ORF type:complete len:615 (+),score=12.70 TRINITY_DN12614_c0_g2_i6:234-1847(+)